MNGVRTILVTNDDGHSSAGILALAGAMEGLGDVWVVAPESEQSATSHAISIHRPLRIREVRKQWYAVDGTPTDCAYVGVNHILKAQPPAIVVSGINHGPNIADDVTYSGTVAAAMEACILGIPAVAFSLATRGSFDFAEGARFARALVAAVLEAQLPPRFLLNVNIPAGPLQGYAVTRLGKHTYGLEVVEKKDPRGRAYYWIGGSDYSHEDIPGSDCNAVHDEKLVSVTPLQLDLTDDTMLASVASLPLPGFTRKLPV
jgi:5'-nucleotidase